jgi:glycosyltransferase involved in cell wall biosynthesis
MIGLESMARGRPVIAFDSGGIRDWLQHGTCGELVPPADVAALRQAMQRFLANPGLVTQLGREAASLCRMRYGHSHYLDAMQSVLRQAAGCELAGSAAERVAICNGIASEPVTAGS